MNRYKTYLVVLSSLIIITLTGCMTTPVGEISSITPLYNKKISKNLGKTSGSDSAHSVLGLWMIGKPDYEVAIKEALAKKNADTLINVKVYEKTYYFIVWKINTVVVEGEAVKITGAKK